MTIYSKESVSICFEMPCSMSKEQINSIIDGKELFCDANLIILALKKYKDNICNIDITHGHATFHLEFNSIKEATNFKNEADL